MVEVDGDFLAYALRLHRYAVEHIGRRHRALRVRHDYELRILLEFLQYHIEPLVVCLIEGRVNFVQETEWRGLGFEHREQ